MCKLRPGLAGCKKKPTDKWKTTEVDKKALEKHIFIAQVEMFGSKWNKFEDIRGYLWVQEGLKEDV